MDRLNRLINKQKDDPEENYEKIIELNLKFLSDKT